MDRDAWRSNHHPQFPQLRLSHRKRLHAALGNPDLRSFQVARRRFVSDLLGISLDRTPIVSFDFGDQGHVAISIETRKEVGKPYSSGRGFFRYYELIYAISDERDVVRLRTNYRQHEDVYLFLPTRRRSKDA